MKIDIQYYNIQYYDTQHNYFQHSFKWNVKLSIMSLNVKAVISVYCYANCHLCWVSQTNSFRWVSQTKPLRSMYYCWVSLYWVSLRRKFDKKFPCLNYQSNLCVSMGCSLHIDWDTIRNPTPLGSGPTCTHCVRHKMPCKEQTL